MSEEQSTDNPKDNTDNDTDHSHNGDVRPVRVIVDSLPPPIPQTSEKIAEKKKQKGRKKIKFYAELIVGSAVVIYTVVSVCLWLAARDANRISAYNAANVARNFQVDERAWVGFGIGGTVTFTVDQPFLIPTRTSNSGKTPAKNVHGNIVVGVVEKGEPLNFDYTGHSNANWGIESGTIFPNGSVDESFQALHTGTDGKPEVIILRKPLWNALNTGQAFIVVHGKVIYNDIFGTEHWTTFCRYATNPSLISKQCIEYNETDEK